MVNTFIFLALTPHSWHSWPMSQCQIDLWSWVQLSAFLCHVEIMHVIFFFIHRHGTTLKGTHQLGSSQHQRILSGYQQQGCWMWPLWAQGMWIMCVSAGSDSGICSSCKVEMLSSAVRRQVLGQRKDNGKRRTKSRGCQFLCKTVETLKVNKILLVLLHENDRKWYQIRQMRFNGLGERMWRGWAAK